MRRLSGMDAFMLYSETPTVHMHTLKIAIIDIATLDSPFGAAELKRVLGRRLHKLEPLRYVLLDIPLKLHHPMWQENCEVDLDYHVRSRRVPEPGGRAELNRLIGEIAGEPLARDRPLWEMYLIEGLEGGRVAVAIKIHHALADGVAAANLIALGMDITTGVQEEKDVPHPDTPPGACALIASALADHGRQVRRLPADLRYTVAGWRRVGARRGHRTVEALRPFEPPATFINHKIDAERTFDTATLSLGDVKQTAKALGVTINDLVLATCAGALRSLQAEHGEPHEPMMASVPVSFGSTPGRVSGNMLSGLLVGLPTDQADTLQRVRSTQQSALKAKDDFALLGPELTSRWLEYLPPSLGEWVFDRLARAEGHNKMYNVAISNVPGPRERGRFSGATITEIYSVGPLTAACALNITVWSYVDQLNISVLSDGATFSDLHHLTDTLVESFIDIRGAAGLSGPLTPMSVAMANQSR